MHVPSLQPVNSSHFCVSGDVTIHPTAVIASGVLLQADPESHIVIGAGVCLGMGTILHAHQGTLEVEAEVTIGAGVLLIGAGKIGASACIGAASTLWNHSIDRGTIIPPLSLLGMPGEQVAETAAVAVPEPTPEGQSLQKELLNGAVDPASSQPAAEIQLSFSTPVYGQENLNRLLSTLLPHRQTFLKGQE
ncbi:transferase [Stenomitos frigidus]|uniref:Transferase n=1 Tax=Stenomitos frigidus ULC18 TaxID=2107698 RepID=A0A2T1E9F3_9CYAN|nr:transferase [Stenomitos frigidus]PSB29341.1 transferase [Stenomitos frigidus ULC18]